MPRPWPTSPSPDARDDELPMAEATDRAHCGRSTLVDAIRHGQVKARRVGRRVFVKIASLRRWIADRIKNR